MPDWRELRAWWCVYYRRVEGRGVCLEVDRNGLGGISTPSLMTQQEDCGWNVSAALRTAGIGMVANEWSWLMAWR